jgi:hypothetical protein
VRWDPQVESLSESAQEKKKALFKDRQKRFTALQASMFLAAENGHVDALQVTLEGGATPSMTTKVRPPHGIRK